MPESEPTPPNWFARAVAHPLAFWGRVAVAAYAFRELFGARGQPRLLLGLATAIPLALLLVDGPFRRRQRSALSELWADLARPSAEWRKWWAGAVFVALPAAIVYLWHPYYHIDSGDTWAAMPTAVSVLRDGNVEIGEFVPLAPASYRSPHPVFEGLPYGTVRVNGRVYSRYPVGMSAFAVPTAALALACGADVDSEPVLAALERLASATVAALVLVLFFRLAVQLAPPRTAVLAAWLLALGSALNSTIGQSLWQHGGVATGALAILVAELVPWFRSRRWPVAGQGAAVGLMYACRLSSGWVVLVLGLGVLVRSPRRGFALGLAGAFGVLPWVAFYQSVYGTPFGPSQSQMSAGEWRWAVLDPLLGVLMSPSRGLLVYQPWAVLAAFGLAARGRSVWAWVLAVTAAGHTLLVASWACWWGGACWGSRLLAEVQPLLLLLALPAVTWLRRSWAGWTVLVALFAWSATIHLLGVWMPRLHLIWDQERGATMWRTPNFFE